MTRHVLITGTTSGLGLGLARHYLAHGWRVTAINRRDPGQQFMPGQGEYRPMILDVRDALSIHKFVRGLWDRHDLPDLWLLTAGINRLDNTGGPHDMIRLGDFQSVLETNLLGVMNVVTPALEYGAIQTFVCASSTTNIVPNPRNLAYYLSKWSLHEVFRRLDAHRIDSGMTRFRSLILGPINTSIPVGATGVQKRVRDWLAVDVDDAVPVIAKFLEGRRQALYYPARAVWAMRALKLALKIAPGLYR